MLTADRDFKPGGEHFAIPTQGEIEGKLLDCEVVAVACLQELLMQQHSPAIDRVGRRILRDLKNRCRSLKLCTDDEKATTEYALQILASALREARSQ